MSSLEKTALFVLTILICFVCVIANGCPCESDDWPDAMFDVMLNYDPATDNLTLVGITQATKIVDRSGGPENEWVCKVKAKGGYGYDHYGFKIPSANDRLYSFDGGYTQTFSIRMIVYDEWNATSFDIFDPNGKLRLTVLIPEFEALPWPGCVL